MHCETFMSQAALKHSYIKKKLEQEKSMCLLMPTCVFVQCKQTGHVSRKDVIGDRSEPARISVGSDHIEDFCARLRVAADAHGVLIGVKHWSVIVQVLHLNVNIGLCTQSSLGF